MDKMSNLLEDDNYPSALFLCQYNEHRWRLKHHKDPELFWANKSYKRYNSESFGMSNKNQVRYSVV